MRGLFHLFVYFPIYLLCFWLCWVFVAACRLSLVVASGGYSLAGVHGFLVVVASLVEHRPEGPWAQELWCTGLVAPWHGESSWSRDWTGVPFIGRWILLFLFLPLYFFNGRIFALQNFVVFWHTSTRISHRYTHGPSLLNLLSISLPIPPF